MKCGWCGALCQIEALRLGYGKAGRKREYEKQVLLKASRPVSCRFVGCCEDIVEMKPHSMATKCIDGEARREIH